MGDARAIGLAMLGDKLPAEQAAAWGLIWQCVDDAELAPTVDRLAQGLAAAPTLGLARTKQAIYGSWSRTLAEQLDIERDMQRELGWSADYAEGVRTATKDRTPGDRVAVLFLGSTIGNFSRGASVSLLRNVRACLRSGDSLFLEQVWVKLPDPDKPEKPEKQEKQEKSK